MEKMLQQLNPSQQEAVTYQDGPSLIIAGAGSGKTRVLTYKIAYQILQGLPPDRILALTFTNKAAREMKERIAELIGDDVARRLWAGTFHAVFSRILRREADRLGFTSDFTIYDSADSKSLLQTIIKERQLDDKLYKPTVVQKRISNAKNALFTAEQYAANRELIENDIRCRLPEIKDIYATYRNRCFQAGAMDFDDLLLLTNILFRDHRDVAEQYRQLFRSVFVDEYQDTNYAQHMIVQQLTQAHQNICVVGDDAQSIYSFRGANIDNILNFRQTYPNARIFKLEQNYRSTQTIVNAANSLIGKNERQIRKHVYSEKETGEKLLLLNAGSDLEEGYSVAARISEMRLRNQYAYNDFAILYRTNAQSRIFEEALRKRNIPYRIYGGLSFYQRKEVKDIIAYFRMAVNPHDEESLKRTINYPQRGIGEVTIAKIAAAATERNVSLWTALTDLENYHLHLSAGVVRKLTEYRDLIRNFVQQNATDSADVVGKNILQQTGIVSELYNDRTPEGLNRVQNMEELLSSLKSFVENRREEGVDGVGLSDFLAEVSLLTDQDTKDDEQSNDRVSMMTIHASKGLEFKNVFIVGLEEELFPLAMADSTPFVMEEERRLFYVAITRTEEHCTLSYAQSRYQYGHIKTRKPSRFLKDIDPQYLKAPSVREASNAAYRPVREAPFDREAPERPATPPWDTPAIHREPAPAVAPETKPQSPVEDLAVGDIISHPLCGRGTVEDLMGIDENRRAIVLFDKAGRRTMYLRYAKYEILTKK